MPETPDGRTRLLMIDDDRKLCRLVAAYLGPLGFDVTAATPAPRASSAPPNPAPSGTPSSSM